MSKEIKELIDTLEDCLKNPNLLDRAKPQRFYNGVSNLQQKVEQLENIRKEAIEATKDVKQFVYDELVDRNVSGATETHCKIMDLLNILNKGSE